MIPEDSVFSKPTGYAMINPSQKFYGHSVRIKSAEKTLLKFIYAVSEISQGQTQCTLPDS